MLWGGKKEYADVLTGLPKYRLNLLQELRYFLYFTLNRTENVL